MVELKATISRHDGKWYCRTETKKMPVAGAAVASEVRFPKVWLSNSWKLEGIVFQA